MDNTDMTLEQKTLDSGTDTTFEQKLLRLDHIVKLLEKGDAPLDDALKLFEESAELVRVCGKMLDEAEQRVVRLQKGGDGQPEEYRFDEEE